MKLNRTLYAVLAIATLTLTSQTFARGGGGGMHTTRQGPVGGVEAQNMTQ